MLEITLAPTPPPAPLPPCRFRFPDPARADAEGLIAQGGDLEPSTLIGAYRQGIFPWPYDEHALLWWSPDPRAIVPLDGLHVDTGVGQVDLRQPLDATTEQLHLGAGRALLGAEHGRGVHEAVDTKPLNGGLESVQLLDAVPERGGATRGL